MLLKITMQPEDLFYTVKNSPKRCPIAKAINRTLAENGMNIVTSAMNDVIYWHKGGYKYAVTAPKQVCEFIRAFDLGNSPELITFELELE